MQNDPAEQSSGSLVSHRALEIVVSLTLIGLSAVVIFDSHRLGFGWASDGPQPGYFPFYVAVFMAGASAVNLFRAILGREASLHASFISKEAMKRLSLVLAPTILYVVSIGILGIYVSSAVFIAGFMLYFGSEGVVRSLLVGLAVPLALFFMFERWFLVPLPKGPLEAALGY